MKSKDFVLGYLTLADFVVSEASYYVENVIPEVYNKYEALSSIRKSFESMKEIQSYYGQQNAVKGPFLPPIGKVKFWMIIIFFKMSKFVKILLP